MHGVADAGGDVEIEQFRSCASEHNVVRLDVAVDQPPARQFRQLARLGFRQVALATFSIKLPEARRIRMKSDERAQQVECDVYCLPVAKVSLSGDELLQ